MEAAAKAAGVSRETVFRRLREPDFKKCYDAARQEVLTEATATAQKHIGAALDQMRAIMDDQNVSPQTQLNAAQYIVSATLRLTDTTDTLRYLRELEEESDAIP